MEPPLQEMAECTNTQHALSLWLTYRDSLPGHVQPHWPKSAHSPTHELHSATKPSVHSLQQHSGLSVMPLCWPGAQCGMGVGEHCSGVQEVGGREMSEECLLLGMDSCAMADPHSPMMVPRVLTLATAQE